MSAIAWVLAGLAATVGAELASRRAVSHRIDTLVSAVIDPLAPLAVHLPGRPLLPDLIRGRLPAAVVTCPHVGLPGIEVRDVTLRLRDIAVNRSLEVVRGHGTLDGHITADEVLRRAGVPGSSLELTEGAMTVRWPSRRLRGLPGLRLRPVLKGQRIRLSPSPVTFTLRSLPAGVSLTDVGAREHGLEVAADLDLPTLLQGDR